MAWFLKVLKKAGWLHLIAYFFCLCFFSVQMYRLVEHLVSPTMTHTFVREVPLKDMMDFPLDILVCVRPSLNSTVLKEFGYDNTAMYAAGSTFRSNYSSIGWGGHDQNGRNLTTARKLLNKAKLNVTKDILRKSIITTHKDDMKELFGADLVRINHLHDCHILKLGQEDMKEMKDISIYFKEQIQNSSVEVKLQGHGLTPHREILKHRFYSSGDLMKLNRLTATGYIVKIKETVFVEEDSSQTCRNYPTSEFRSYTECDDEYVMRRINELAPGFNLTPVWTQADNLDLVTTQPLSINGSVQGKELKLS